MEISIDLLKYIIPVTIVIVITVVIVINSF